MSGFVSNLPKNKMKKSSEISQVQCWMKKERSHFEFFWEVRKELSLLRLLFERFRWDLDQIYFAVSFPRKMDKQGQTRCMLPTVNLQVFQRLEICERGWYVIIQRTVGHIVQRKYLVAQFDYSCRKSVYLVSKIWDTAEIASTAKGHSFGWLHKNFIFSLGSIKIKH